MKFEYKTVFVLTLFFSYVKSATYEGDSCFDKGLPGTCRNIRNCPSALEDIKKQRNPQICGFSNRDPIVCCVNAAASKPTSPRPVATTSTFRPSTTTQYIPPVYDYRDNTGEAGNTAKQCPALSADITRPKTGKKAWDKCIEYQEKLVYPCEKDVVLAAGDGMSRANHCGHDADDLIVGGVEAGRGEFPHMALLGYGDDSATAQWLCGGSLLSDKFILTAGHCTSSRDLGPITFALIGVHRRDDPLTGSKLYKVRRIIKHPEYKPPSKYHDIALLETETNMQLDRYAVPACLPVSNNVNDDRGVASGWGALEYRGGNSDTLQKVILNKFTVAECSEIWPASRLMKIGFDSNTQMCFGDKTKSKDTCQGDSGGPLQVKNLQIKCMYDVIGVTSFGRACGYIGEAGIYTKVSHYVPWIESIVFA